MGRAVFPNSNEGRAEKLMELSVCLFFFFFPEKAPRLAPVRAGVGTGVAVASPLTRTRVLTGAPVFKGS